MLIRVILLLLAVWVVIQLVRRWRTDSARRAPERLDANMSRCAHCGTFIPVNEAIVRGEHSYCSTQHLKADQEADRH